ncbi:hypothetical protein Z948_54 [Sulfitobacter donghicola DSW-25 = KCTC 12864 = JCM 14565]|nr:hypothetical protein Z948_54 [Sulfitobacter donghicola DSW-25 = KCTC 12864 = JCM 14565]
MGPPLPRFQGILHGHKEAHHLSISDPTLLMSAGLTSTWYQGSSQSDVPAILARMIAAVKKRLGIKRSIYIGASSGGFAALDQGFRDSGSVVIAANPQTNLKRHHEVVVKNYYNEFWSAELSFQDFLQMNRLNLPETYRTKTHSKVIYIQNTSDRFHYFNHYVPFVSTFPQTRNFIADVGFWGVLDHANSAPFNETVKLWLDAALMSESCDANDILMNKRQMDLERLSATAPATEGRSAGVKPLPTADIAMTKRIRDWQLSEKKV